jgi:hypothetical protein
LIAYSTALTPVTGDLPSSPDEKAPTPDPMTFAIVPCAAGAFSVAMTATEACDPSGVEYYFACTAGGGHDSGWQDGSTYTDTDLTNNTSYTYKVKARDMSDNLNETEFSAEQTATTPLYSCSETIDSDLDSDCQVNFLDYAVFADAWATQSPLGDINGDNNVDLFDLAQLTIDWLTCNRDPATECWQ